MPRPILPVELTLAAGGGAPTRIILGGLDITQHVRAVRVESHVRDLTSLHLELTCVQINVPIPAE